MSSNKDLIDAVFRKTGIKLSEDDPAFLLVELNALILSDRIDESRALLDRSAEKLNADTLRTVDEFVGVANSTLSKFSTQTREIVAALEAAKSTAPAADSQGGPSGVARLLTWLLPLMFGSGLVCGAGLALLIYR